MTGASRLQVKTKPALGSQEKLPPVLLRVGLRGLRGFSDIDFPICPCLFPSHGYWVLDPQGCAHAHHVHLLQSCLWQRQIPAARSCVRPWCCYGKLLKHSLFPHGISFRSRLHCCILDCGGCSHYPSLMYSDDAYVGSHNAERIQALEVFTSPIIDVLSVAVCSYSLQRN